MKTREHSISGVVNINGSMLITNKGELDRFIEKWKGSRFIATFMVVSRGSSSAMKSYYYHKIVPDVWQARWENGDRSTKEQTEVFLRELSPIMWREIPDIQTGKYSKELREISDLDNLELVRHIEYIKQFAAENLGVFIEDPNVI